MSNPNRVHIDAPAGVIDLEGEKDFVEGLLAKLFPLIEEAGFGRRPKLNGQEPIAEEAPAADAEPVDNANGKARSRTRKAGKRPPAGHSCPERLLSLRADGFFREKRNTSDIVAGLKEKGSIHNTSQVSAAAGSLFKKGELRRMFEGRTPYYFWDRD
jgi:hypothetical protein